MLRISSLDHDQSNYFITYFPYSEKSPLKRNNFVSVNQLQCYREILSPDIPVCVSVFVCVSVKRSIVSLTLPPGWVSTQYCHEAEINASHAEMSRKSAYA